MAKTIAQLRQEAQTIRDASAVGENTATRVGGAIEDVVDYIEEDVALEYGSSREIDLLQYTKQTRNINASTLRWESVENVYCRIVPITTAGTYTVKAENGLGGCAVLTSSDTSVGTSAQFAPEYPNLVYMVQGETATFELSVGRYLYVRDDVNPAGRVLPKVFMGTIDPVLRDSDIPTIRRKTLNCLFVGNSVSQDHVAYLPWLLKNTYGDDVYFRICIAYKSGYTIAGYVSDICTGNVDLGIFSVADNVQGWTNTNNYPWANIWTNYGHFDLICFEGYFNHGTSSAGMVEDPTKFADFIADLKSRQTEPFKLGYLMHQTYTTSTHTEADAWARITGGAEYAIQNNPVSILFPCGAVTKLVNGAIPQSFLTNDLTHNQQGLPCIMGAYVLMEELARYVGLPSKILNNPLRITSSIETALHIPGPNGTLQIGTDAQYAICQDAAAQSVKWGDNLVITNSGEIL